MFYIERKDGELKKEIYGFTMFGLTICLDSYYLRTRESTRKRTWNNEKGYERLGSRRYSMREEDIIIPEDVKIEAIELTRKKINLVKWSEYKR